MAKFKGTASGIRNHVAALTTPTPKGREAKKKRRAEMREMQRGPELGRDELRDRTNHTTRVEPRRKNPRGNRSQQRSRSIGDQL